MLQQTKLAKLKEKQEAHARRAKVYDSRDRSNNSI
jgi:hypothetical protein